MQFTQDEITLPKKECLKKKAKVLVCPALFLLLLILQTFNLSMHVYSFRAQSVSLQIPCGTIAIFFPLYL